MAEKHVPKYIVELLDRRRRLANKLMDVCYDIDSYCEKIGLSDSLNPDEYDEAAIDTSVRIYCEPDAAYECTYHTIEKFLNNEEGK